ncbi:putattive exported protein [Bordetella ansorpii]|uniref:Putattive exported protein n=1 Tax=Bordetella ansorpii TaxID=288768 RepID=A0A157SBT8_9BORD|nr:tripartite tricarboxylate transporter substrate-binding protein [Bordetella ansorpii]SAI67824.1 putattive exported protein [Bordetella ansorpii]
MIRPATLALAAGLTCAGTAAQAQEAFPAHPITIIVGYSAGGANDILARILADRLTVSLKQPVIVENKPGVASIVGATYVAKAKPDGYTLLMGASGPISFNPALYKSLPYAPDKDLAPISLVGTFPLILLTQSANKETSTLKGLKAYAAANPKKSNYSASAASFQLMTELFKKQTGTHFEYIPYKGSMDSITAVSTGDATMTLVDAGPATPMIKGGRVRALAVTSAQRTPYLPDVPTMKEAGIDMDVELWSGLFAPAGTPPAVIATLQRSVRDALQAPEVRQRIAALSITPKSNTPEEFAALIGKEIALWKRVAQEAGVQPN